MWKFTPNIEALNDMGQNTIASQIGIEFTEVHDDYLVATMPDCIF